MSRIHELQIGHWRSSILGEHMNYFTMFLKRSKINNHKHTSIYIILIMSQHNILLLGIHVHEIILMECLICLKDVLDILFSIIEFHTLVNLDHFLVEHITLQHFHDNHHFNFLIVINQKSSISLKNVINILELI